MRIELLFTSPYRLFPMMIGLNRWPPASSGGAHGSKKTISFEKAAEEASGGLAT